MMLLPQLLPWGYDWPQVVINLFWKGAPQRYVKEIRRKDDEPRDSML
jgi:hypothetical protein